METFQKLSYPKPENYRVYENIDVDLTKYRKFIVETSSPGISATPGDQSETWNVKRLEATGKGLADCLDGARK